MCGRYIVKSSADAIAAKYGVKVDEIRGFKPNFNLSIGELAPVITDDNPSEARLLRFGFCPKWAKKSMYIINARAEGDKNPENDPNYRGPKEIIHKPAFRQAIRSQRCLVIADAFIEGTTKEKLSKPYVVYLKNKKQLPFAFAGIWDTWIDKSSGEIISSFAIITTTANKILQAIPHHRSPVILNGQHAEKRWLDNNSPITDVLDLLKPYPDDEMNAYPIEASIKNPQNKTAAFVKAIGEPILSNHHFLEENQDFLQQIKSSSARRKKLQDRNKT